MIDELKTVFVNDWAFCYCQKNGNFGIETKEFDDAGYYRNCIVFAVGYSGRGEHMDDPSSEHLPGKGPIPAGKWFIGTARNHERLGPVAIPLLPDDGWQVPGGRSGFFIHGDNRAANKTASSGCIVLDRRNREFIASQAGRQLIVIHE